MVQKCYSLLFQLLRGFLGGGNGVKQSMDYNTSNFDSIPGSVWMVISFATLLIAILMVCCSLVLFSVVTVGAIFNYIKIFRGERNNPQFKNVFGPFYDGSAGKIILLSIVKGGDFCCLDVLSSDWLGICNLFGTWLVHKQLMFCLIS